MKAVQVLFVYFQITHGTIELSHKQFPYFTRVPYCPEHVSTDTCSSNKTHGGTTYTENLLLNAVKRSSTYKLNCLSSLNGGTIGIEYIVHVQFV